ncbi:MAG: helical backbone metal receptor [Acidobacteria bacterium]|nr:helical backbone metal receptor [Acidobacteriota bacterium]
MAPAAEAVRLAVPPGRALLVAFALLGAAHCRRNETSPPLSRAAAHPAPARRVVALAPNLTEIVFALGSGSTLVGVSEHSDFPEATRSIPRVGGLEVSAERVASLTPDLVLATADGGNRKGAVSALEASGVPVLVVPGGSLDEVLSGIFLVAGRLGRDAEAARLTDSLRKRREAVRQSVAARPRPRAVLLVWPDPPSAAGGGTFLDDVLTEAGAQNLLSDRPGWPVVSGEWLATAPIEVVVVPDSPVNRPVFERSFASGALSRGSIRAARVVRVDESSLTRPGPRVFDALEQLARGLSR